MVVVVELLRNRRSAVTDETGRGVEKNRGGRRELVWLMRKYE